MEIEFIAGVAVVSADPDASARLYVDALGLPLDAAEGDDYRHSENVGGSRHFGVWPLHQVAQACFGTETWPADEAAVAAAAAGELTAAGFDLLHEPRTEPWGQTVARLQSLEGLVVGISFAPWMH